MNSKLKSLTNVVNILLSNNNIRLASSCKRLTGINLAHSLEHSVKHDCKLSKVPRACWIEGIPLIILVIETPIILLEVYLFYNVAPRGAVTESASQCTWKSSLIGSHLIWLREEWTIVWRGGPCK